MSQRQNFLKYDPVACAEADVATCVSEYRYVGYGAVKAIAHLARKMRLTGNRMTTLYYRGQNHTVTREEQHWIARGAIRVLIHLAQQHEEAAARCRLRAEEICDRQRQYELQLGETSNEWDALDLYRLAA